MPSFPPPRDRDVPPIGDASLSALLAGDGPRPGSPHELYWLAEALAGLTGEPAGDELAGEAETMAAFRGQFGAAGAPHWARPRSRRPRRVPTITAIAVVLGLGGAATAAYAGVLPAAEQRIAHDLIGAPEPATQPSTQPAHTRPATGTPSGAASHPGASPSAKPQPAPAAHGSGKPSEHPTPSGSGKPSERPTPRSSGKPTELPTPSAHPTPHGSSRPAEQPTGKPSRQS